jgi:glyceraldehyde-3-phosphate dehydrogenase/erythrose-4-phosphate dehydrogenase
MPSTSLPRISTKAAINGLGRIGRAILRLVIDEPSFELVAVNDLVDAENLAYLLRFDTVYGDTRSQWPSMATTWSSPAASCGR